MKTADIIKGIERCKYAGMTFGNALEELGLSRDSRSDEGLTLIEIFAEDDFRLSIGELRSYILIGCLSVNNTLGDEADRVISYLLSSLRGKEFTESLFAIVKAEDFDLNAMYDGKFFIEHVVERKHRFGAEYTEFVNSLIADDKLDISKVNGAGENIAQALVKAEAAGFIMPLIAQRTSTEIKEQQLLKGVSIKAILEHTLYKESQVDFDSFMRLFDVLEREGLSLGNADEVCKNLKAIMRVLNENKRSEEFSYIIKKLLQSQEDKGAFVHGLLMNWVYQYRRTQKEAARELLFNILETVPLADISESLRGVEGYFADDFKRSVSSVIEGSLELVPSSYIDDIASLCGIDHDVDLEILKKRTVICRNSLSLLLDLHGRAEALAYGDFEGGHSDGSTLYIIKLLSLTTNAGESGSSATPYNALLERHLADAVYYNKHANDLASCRHFASLKAEYIARKAIERIKTTGLLVLTGWSGHAVSLWIKGNYIYRCNGGGCSTDSTIEVYEITKADALRPELLNRIYSNEFSEDNKDLIQRDLHEILGLKLICSHEWAFQRSGSCSLHSSLLGMQAIIASHDSDELGVVINQDLLSAAGLKMFDIRQEMRYQGIVIGVREAQTATLKMFSRFISLAHGEDIEQDRALIVRVLSEGHIEISESMVLEQMYEVFLLRSKKFDAIEDYLDFLKGIGVYPFCDGKVYGTLAATLACVTASTEAEVVVSDEDIMKFHKSVSEFSLLHIVVRAGNVDLAKRIVTLEPNLINMVDINKVSPIGYARSLEMLEFLLSSGANPEWGSDYSESVAYRLVVWADYEMIKAAVDSGAKIHPETLMFAPHNGDIRVLELLLDKVPGTETTHSRRNALHVASSLGAVKHLQVLLASKKMRSAQLDVNGRTPLSDAVAAGREEAVILLSNHPQVSAVTPYRGDKLLSLVRDKGITESLCARVERASLEKDESLIYFRDNYMLREENAVLREEAKADKTLWLISIVRSNDLKAFKGAMQLYPDINLSEYDEFFSCTVLHAALETKVSMEFLETILSLPGIELDCRNGGGETLAQIAALMDNDVALQVLHKLGAPMNAPDCIGVTPLMDAAERGCLKAVRALTSIADLDSNYRGFKGHNALDMVRNSQSSRCYGEVREEITKLVEAHQDALLIEVGADDLACAGAARLSNSA